MVFHAPPGLWIVHVGTVFLNHIAEGDLAAKEKLPAKPILSIFLCLYSGEYSLSRDFIVERERI